MKNLKYLSKIILVLPLLIIGGLSLNMLHNSNHNPLTKVKTTKIQSVPPHLTLMDSLDITTGLISWQRSPLHLVVLIKITKLILDQ